MVEPWGRRRRRRRGGGGGRKREVDEAGSRGRITG